ncbi:MAG: STAS domain-containing protein [Ilumatobacteraceae bacterium]
MQVRHFLPPTSTRARRPRLPRALRQGGVAVVRESPSRLQLRGELDVVGAPLVAGLLADRAIEELDVSGVSFVDAAGLAPLLAARDARPDGGLRLVTPSTAVTRILELSGEVDAFAVWP